MNNDFVHVQLTQAGLDQAQGHPVQINGRTAVVLLPGQTTRVAKYEWDYMLQHSAHPLTGDKLVEIVPGTHPEFEKET